MRNPCLFLLDRRPLETADENLEALCLYLAWENKSASNKPNRRKMAWQVKETREAGQYLRMGILKVYKISKLPLTQIEIQKYHYTKKKFIKPTSMYYPQRLKTHCSYICQRVWAGFKRMPRCFAVITTKNMFRSISTFISTLNPLALGSPRLTADNMREERTQMNTIRVIL